MLDIIIGGAILGAIFALISIGLNLQYGVTRILNIAHGEFLILGAYVTYLFFRLYGVNPLVSLVISGPAVFILGVFVQVIVFRKLVYLSKSAEELEFRSLLACFGLQFIIQNSLRYIIDLIIPGFGATPIGSPYLNVTISVFGEAIQLNMIVAAATSILISAAMYFLLRSTIAGLVMRATVEEPTGAQLVGINILKTHAISFGLGALLSALAGSLWSMIFSDITPYKGTQFTFIALTVVVLGGMGSFVGSLLGGFLIGFIYYVTWKLEPLLYMAVVYVFLLMTLIIRPKGIFGK